MLIVRTLLAAASLAVAATAGAQSAPAEPVPTTRIEAPAPHTCTKPGEHPGRQGADASRRKWTNDANAYLECLKKYALDHQAIAKPLYEQAKPHADAANAAIDEYNQSVKLLKEASEKNN